MRRFVHEAVKAHQSALSIHCNGIVVQGFGFDVGFGERDRDGRHEALLLRMDCEGDGIEPVIGRNGSSFD